MKPLSYTQLQDKYSGKFVATYKGKVIASAKTSKKLFEKIKKFCQGKKGKMSMQSNYVTLFAK